VSASLAEHYLKDILRTYRTYKSLGERALAQVPDRELHTQLDPESNSLAVIIKHLAGNLRSRFSDFLTTDGEKPDRHRDGEFEMNGQVPREELIRWWDAGWATALGSIEALTADDLERTVAIRGEPFLVLEALDRLAAHTAYHVGQIVFLAKHFAGPDWKSLTIPRGQSQQAGWGTYKQEAGR
jgi:hypothetical protein